MKKFRSIILALAALICCQASAQELTADNVSITPNGTAELVISLSGSTDVARGAQFDINLPDGIEVVSNSSGRLQYERGEILNDDESVSIQKVKSGAVRVILYSMYNDPLKSANGEILRVPLQADGAAVGEYTGSLTNIKFGVDGNSYISGSDEQGFLKDSEFTITVSNPTGIGRISVEDEDSDTAWYTLMGVRLSNKPVQAGVYIHNGRKIILR